MSRMASRWVSVLVWVGACLAPAAGMLGASAPPIVEFSTRHGKSARLRDHRPNGPVRPGAQRQIPNKGVAKKSPAAPFSVSDPVAQRQFGLSQPVASIQFEGLSDDDNAAVNGFRIVPPDTEGDVGPDHYFQYINDIAAIYDKSGNVVLGPFAGNAFWAGLGGPCEVQNDGDPLVRYDRQADRWVVSQFALPNFPDGPFYQCIAVSTTNDPTGEYYQYEFLTNETFFTDYGKIGIWPDAYYMSFNMFGPNGEVEGGAYAFDRGAMLAGAEAGMVIFSTGGQVGVLPSDLDGPTPPPAGSPNYFMTYDVNPARLLQWQFHVDWTTPANSTFTGPVEIPVAEFINDVCDDPNGRQQCVPQLDSPEKLETLGNRLMYRLVYRNFGDHESLVVNHTVGTETGSAALRWYELRSPGAAPVVYQQGTYAPDANFRWMGSMAMDKDGNIALGYSKSSAAMYPSIAATGRLAGDPLGTMGAEDVLIAGGGSQFGSSSRWGDYSTMSIDPVDDCTFWYTQEYYTDSSSFDFKTRIGAMRFPSCTSGPSGALEGTVTGNSGPIAGVTVTAGESHTTTDAAGHYQFLTLPAGDVRRHGLEIRLPAGDGDRSFGHRRRDHGAGLHTRERPDRPRRRNGQGRLRPGLAALREARRFRPDRIPRDDSLQRSGDGLLLHPASRGLHLRLRGDLSRPGIRTGRGSSGGGRPASAPNAAVANWTLAVSPTCTAPGYGAGAFVGPLALSESFDAGVLPAGWSVDTRSGASWKVYTDVEPCFIENATGGSGPYAMVNTGCEGPADTFLVTPTMDLSGRTSAAIQWANDYITDQFEPSVVKRGRERRRRVELDERVDAGERRARPGQPDRRHVLRRRTRQRCGALPLSELLLADVAGGRCESRKLRVRRDSRRPRRGNGQRCEHGRGPDGGHDPEPHGRRLDHLVRDSRKRGVLQPLRRQRLEVLHRRRFRLTSPSRGMSPSSPARRHGSTSRFRPAH